MTTLSYATFVCPHPICNYETNDCRPSRIKSHAKRHKNPFKFKCSYNGCDYEANGASPSDILSHIAEDHFRKRTYTVRRKDPGSATLEDEINPGRRPDTDVALDS